MSSSEPKSMLGAALAAIQVSGSSGADADANNDNDDPAPTPPEAASAASFPPTRGLRVSRRLSAASAKRVELESSSDRPVVAGLDEGNGGDPPRQGTASGGPTSESITATSGSGFPASLHAFVKEGSETFPQGTSWDEDGTSFYVNESTLDPVWNELMKNHFGHDDFDTLIRQLKAYGFKKGRSKKAGQSLWYNGRFSRESVDFELIAFRGKHVEPSTLPVPTVDNGDFVRKLPRKGVTTSSEPDPSQMDAKKEGFPLQLHEFVTAMVTSNPTMISFTDDGESIRVWEDHPDLANVLEENFRNSSLGFFTQNLLAYGWKRDSDPTSRVLYLSHPHFHRDRSKCDFSKIIPCDASKPSSPSSSLPSPSADAAEGQQSSPMAADDPSRDGSPPEPTFRVNQTVFARDTDGVMYEAVIRRRLYGQSQQKQVQLGLVASEHEAEELLSRDEEPTWHYFVHYNRWNVNWDRWVPECNVYEATDQIKAYADRLLSAHRSLRSELTKKVKGKKGFQTVEGSEFLQHWRIVRAKIDEEMRPDGDPNLVNANELPSLNEQGPPSKTKKAEANPWSSKSALTAELKLRERSLTSVGSGGRGGGGQAQQQLTLPFALKKCLVESWEVITQCDMVLELPAPVTVRQALDKYLESKGVAPSQEGDAPGTSSAGTPGDPKEGGGPTAAPASADSGDDAAAAANQRELLRQQQSEWRDMADGIAMLFDEALPDRLLYREEWPQFHVLCDHPEYSMRRFSDLYGCEHLLRLFVRLPDLVSDGMCESDARPVLAKVNDLARFLHKNQGTVLAQPYRKPSDAEARERARLTKKEAARRKRQLESATAPEDGDLGSKRPKPSLIVEGVEVVMH